jgi:Ca-activated chloride channel homolog
LFRFAHIQYFYLLALIPFFTALLFLFLVWKKRTLAKYGDMAVIRQLMPDYSVGKPILKFIVLMFALAGLTVALADPQTGSRLEKVKRKGIDLMICLDVSNSMLAQDIKPNRLERAKQSIVRLVDNLEGDRIGIIVFAGKAYTQLPITTDYAAAKMFTASINTGIVSTQGTAIAEAIETAAKSFGESKHNKAIVVITDGEDHEGMCLNRLMQPLKRTLRSIPSAWDCPKGRPSRFTAAMYRPGIKKTVTDKPS